MRLSEQVTAIPFLHGKSAFTHEVRNLCLNSNFDCIAIDIPEIFQNELFDAVEKLPFINAVMARENDTVFYIPVDPCDPAIEGIRQGFQNHTPVFCIGSPELSEPIELPPLPDEYASTMLGFDIYNTLCIETIGNNQNDLKIENTGLFIANRIHSLQTKFKNILVLIHFRNFLKTVHFFNMEKTYNLSFPEAPKYEFLTKPINPDHLYFALGELPFITGKYEKERYDPFSKKFDIIEAVKDLFRETRDEYFDHQDEIYSLSPVRIQAALTFLRNLSIMSGQLIPSLLDIVECAKGVGGNSYAIRILKSSKYYPYFQINDQDSVNIGINKVSISDWGRGLKAVNLFRDFRFQWRSIIIRPDPSHDLKKKFRFTWNPFNMCSHVPEDRKIENFNNHLRTKAISVISEDFIKNEKFQSSVKDGIDIRETLRNWYTGDIYIKEQPPFKGKIDTVVIIFDSLHDSKYPHCTTWYAEHKEESTLSFYATDPFENMIGPGIAKCYYGGLSLLFPPRAIPNIFEITEQLNLPDLATRLIYGAMLFSNEKNIAYVSSKKPSIDLKNIARKLKKHLIWLPLSTFSNETLRKLRRFHILNGKNVRSWANRFIGD